MSNRALTVLLTLGLLGAPASAETFIETFDGGSNEGDWTYGNPQATILPAGGNPGAYLTSGQFLDTFAPQLRTQAFNSTFLGDFRMAGVTSMGVDLIQQNAATTGGRPCTLMLIHDNGTGTPTDDTAAYFLGPNIPAFGAGWTSYDYDIPSDSTTLPPGWLLLNLGDSGSPPIDDWDTVIQDVNRVQFFYGDPKFFFIFQQWEVGADNTRITMEQTIPTMGEWGMIAMGGMLLMAGSVVVRRRRAVAGI